MTPERWEEITEIYHQARELDRKDCAKFLDAKCAEDAELRGEVESLLAADSDAGNFISASVVTDISSFLSDNDAPFSVGKILGNYEIVSSIAVGGMGEVYLAKDTRLGRAVALKTLPVSYLKDTNYLRRFEAEARAAATLNHPNVAAIYSFEEAEEQPFFTMEYVEGKTLDNFISGGGLDLKIFLEWFIGIADALAHAHEKGVIHRDIKPGNIMITTDGFPKILDFGLAQMDETKIEGDHPTLELTIPGRVVGTPSYMSPEQAEGKKLDHATDLFSFGVVMYEMLTGLRPFRGDSYAAIMGELMTKNPRRVSNVRAEIPFLLERLVMRCLEKRRRNRFGSMREVCLILEETQASLKIHIPSGNSSNPVLPQPTHISNEIYSPLFAPDQMPDTHYAQSGDVNIAYQTIGEGDLDVVFVMGWISHLEYFWKEPHFANFLDRLASFSRLILIDKRGTGLSDRVPNDQLPTLERRMDDVRCVMDAVGSEKAVLVGVSEGGPMCALFAATYPEKTTALVMIGTYAKRTKDDDYPWGVSKEDHENFFEIMRRDWGEAVGIEERAPSLAADESFRNWWATYLRMGASPGAAVALTKMNAEIDVRNILPTISVPTLVIHRTGDQCLNVEEGRFVAEQIPGSKFVEFEGVDHLPFVGNQEEILDEIEEFLTGVRHGEDFDRVLATVMSVKILEPSAVNEKEKKGRDRLLRQAGIYVSRQIELFKGREIWLSKKGILAAFDGPARAIRCARAINDAARRFNIEIKTGLHTGECDVIGKRYSGVAVRLAKAIADEAKVGEILVSRTVKDLVAGSGLDFNEYGVKSFAEVQGDWRLFNVG